MAEVYYVYTVYRNNSENPDHSHSVAYRSREAALAKAEKLDRNAYREKGIPQWRHFVASIPETECAVPIV